MLKVWGNDHSACPVDVAGFASNMTVALPFSADLNGSKAFRELSCKTVLWRNDHLFRFIDVTVLSTENCPAQLHSAEQNGSQTFRESSSIVVLKRDDQLSSFVDVAVLSIFLHTKPSISFARWGLRPRLADFPHCIGLLAGRPAGCWAAISATKDRDKDLVCSIHSNLLERLLFGPGFL